MLAGKRTLSTFVFQALLLIVITAVTFLPNLSQATIFRDDWYYTLDRYYGGSQAFHEMFRIDRPARGYFFEGYYQLFGIEPAPYHAAGFIWRILMGLAALWLFRLLWPRQRQAVFLISLLFVLYPGYTRWMEGFENQPKVVSMCLLVVSIALTLEAIRANRLVTKAALWLGAILSGWVYIALIDYAIGMEIFRLLCVVVFLHHRQPGLPLKEKGLAFARRLVTSAFPALIISGAFLYWRLFIFQNLRNETDIDRHLQRVIDAPLQGVVGWFNNYVRSVLNTGVLAWAPPTFQDLFGFAWTDILLGLALAFLAAALTAAAAWWLGRASQPAAPEPVGSGCPAWHEEAFWIGLLGVLAGVIPVVLANRSVSFGVFSHYAMPASLAAAVLLVGLLYGIANQRKQIGLVFVLVLLAASAQFSASLRVAQEEQAISRFWQQAAWRVPGIREDTALLVRYPSVRYGEDVDAVQGPANFIYFPEPKKALPVRYSLYAMKEYPWTAKEYLAGGEELRGYRTHYGLINFDDLLVMTQPTAAACLRVIDQRYPYYSYDDPDSLLIVGESSDTANVLTNASPPVLKESIFGSEPEHGWCYYFQKADLALQTGDYAAVEQWGAQAQALGLEPAEPLEWMPFLQAQAALGNREQTAVLMNRIGEDAYNRRQACRALQQMEQTVRPFEAAIHEQIDAGLCQPIEK